MTEKNSHTEFAPADRSRPDEIKRLAEQLVNHPEIRTLIDSYPDLVMFLDRNRQIVLVNNRLQQMTGTKDVSEAPGLRPGELFGCIHAKESPGGCGTTRFCRECGAVKSILKSQKGIAAEDECRISVTSGDSLDFRVWATPFKLEGQDLSIFVVKDISNEKRRRVLERVFFHDVLNTASSLKGMCELVTDADPEEAREFILRIGGLSKRVVEEINSQKDLAAAENDELTVNPESMSCTELVNNVADSCRNTQYSEGKTIIVEIPNIDHTIVSDRVMVVRTLGNMLKNALEASGPGDTVKIGFRADTDRVFFSVWNPAVMPDEIKLQLFQRSFSTKGAGRGLGTYSMRLLSRRYLEGDISFTSEEGEGTAFVLELPNAIDADSPMRFP